MWQYWLNICQESLEREHFCVNVSLEGVLSIGDLRFGFVIQQVHVVRYIVKQAIFLC